MFNMTNRPDLIAQLEKLTPTEGEWSSVKDVDFPFITIGDCSLDTDYLMNDDIDLITLAPTMRIEILAMAKEIEELKEELKSTNRKVKYCSASINGALDGLELDNDCDVIEKSTVIEQLKVQLEIITPQPK